MYEFPPTSDIQFLLDGDAKLSQIVIDPYQLTLGLDNGCRIVSQHRVRYESGDQVEDYSEWRDTPSLSIHKLLERRLISVEVEGLVLTLEFEDDARVVILSDLLNFEAGQIYRPDGALIVF